MVKLSLDDYEVTIEGLVFSPNKQITPGLSGNGYLTFYAEGKSRFVHREVARRHIPNPEDKPAVNHKDGCKTNNNVDNLEWVTHSENEKHSYEKLGRVASRGRMYISDALAVQLVARSNEIGSRAAAREAGIPYSTMSALRNGYRKIISEEWEAR